MRRLATFFLAVFATSGALSAVNGQVFDEPRSGSLRDGIISQFDPGGGIGTEPAKVTAQIVPATADRSAVLVISATIADGRHTYSITQPPGGPLPTEI